MKTNTDMVRYTQSNYNCLTECNLTRSLFLAAKIACVHMFVFPNNFLPKYCFKSIIHDGDAQIN